MKYLFRFVLILSLVISALYITPPARAQDEPDCCFQIYSTGRYLGWSAALLEYTRPRTAPSQFDRIIYQQLQRASNTITSSYNSCDGFIEAWPSWRQKQSWLKHQISELQKVTNHQFKRGRVYTQVTQTYFTWGNELSIMKIDDRYVHDITCATCYFRLGYDSAYVAQALRQADEAANRNNNRYEAGRQVKIAQEHLQRMKEVLRSYSNVQQPKGSFVIRCANLDGLYLDREISRLDRACRSIDNLSNKIQEANFLSDEIGRVLLEDCFPPWGSSGFTDVDGWAGDWSMTSKHLSGPSKGGSYRTNMHISFNQDRCEVRFGNVQTATCSISGDTLMFDGRHPSGGGRMSWQFQRNGNKVTGTFSGMIRNRIAHGTYTGFRVGKQ